MPGRHSGTACAIANGIEPMIRLIPPMHGPRGAAVRAVTEDLLVSKGSKSGGSRRHPELLAIIREHHERRRRRHTAAARHGRSRKRSSARPFAEHAPAAPMRPRPARPDRRSAQMGGRWNVAAWRTLAARRRGARRSISRASRRREARRGDRLRARAGAPGARLIAPIRSVPASGVRPSTPPPRRRSWVRHLSRPSKRSARPAAWIAMRWSSRGRIRDHGGIALFLRPQQQARAAAPVVIQMPRRPLHSRTTARRRRTTHPPRRAPRRRQRRRAHTGDDGREVCSCTSAGAAVDPSIARCSRGKAVGQRWRRGGGEGSSLTG